MSYKNELKAGIARAFSSGLPAENPLGTIGLSHSVLELGLSEDDLQDYCRKTARDLLARFHEDRGIEQTPEVVERQRRYAQAFEAIKDEKIFKIALREFKAKISEERDELSAERRTASELRSQIERLEKALAAEGERQTEVEHGVKILSIIKQNLVDYMLTQATLIGDTQDKFGNLTVCAPEKARWMRMITWKIAKEIRDIEPGWQSRIELQEFSEKAIDPKWTPPGLDITPMDREAFRRLTMHLFSVFGQVQVEFRIDEIKVESGFFTDPSTSETNRILGTLDWKDITKQDRNVTEMMKRSSQPMLGEVERVPQDYCLRGIKRILTPGQVLVRLPVKKVKLEKNPAKQLEEIVRATKHYQQVKINKETQHKEVDFFFSQVICGVR